MATTKDFIVKNGLQVLGVGSVASSNTTTGALVVKGGVGVGGAINIGGQAFVLDSTEATNQYSGALQVTGGAGFGGNIYAANIYANGAEVVTTATFNTQGGFVNTITAGTDTVVSTSTGAVTVWNASTLQSVTDRGASTTNVLTISNATASSDTTSGALVVTGGVGIGGDLYIGGTIHGTVAGVITTATNLAGGAATEIPYQSAPGVTAFSANFTWDNANQVLKLGAGGAEIGGDAGYGYVTAPKVYATNLTDTRLVFSNSTHQLVDSANLTFDGTTLTLGGTGTFVTPNINPQNLTNLYIPYYNGSKLVDSGVTFNTFNQLGGYQAVFSSTVEAHGFINKDLTQGRLIFTTDSQGLQGDAANLTFDGSKLTVPSVDATGTVHITNLSQSSTSTGGALVVDGGVGIGKNLNVAGNFNVWGGATFAESVTFNGGATYVLSTNTVYTDNILELHTPPGGVNDTWTIDDGKDIGLRFHYYNRTLSTDSNAAFVLASDSQTFEFYSTGAESNTGTFVGAEYGSIKAAGLKLVSSDNASNTYSGALTVVGGVGIGQDLYIGGTAYINGSPVVTEATLGSASVVNSVTGGTGIAVSASTGNVTISNTGVVELTGSTYLGVSQSTGSVTLTNLGVQTLTAGTDTAVSSSTGTVTIWDTSTLDSVLGRGNSSSQTVSITNTSASTSSISGNAIEVTGGVGADTFYAATDMYVDGSRVVTEATLDAFGGIVQSITAGDGISVDSTTGNVTVTNSGVRTLTAGTGTVVSSDTGTVTVWSSDTLQNVTDRGNSTSNAITITDNTESTDTSSGALQVTGGAAVGKNLNVGGTANIGPAGQILSYSSVSTSTAAQLSLDSFTTSEYQTAKYVVQIVDTGYTPVRIQVEELLVFHDDNSSSTNAYIVRYGIGYSAIEMGDFDATYSGGKVTLKFTPGYNPTSLTVKTLRTAITTAV